MDSTHAQGLVTEYEMSRDHSASASSSSDAAQGGFGSPSTRKEEANQIGLVTEYETDWSKHSPPDNERPNMEEPMQPSPDTEKAAEISRLVAQQLARIDDRVAEEEQQREMLQAKVAAKLAAEMSQADAEL